MNYYIEFLKETNEWQVTFGDHHRIWFDGSVPLKTVHLRAMEVAELRSA